MKVISYCNNKYPDNYGGVARFDYCLSKIIPDRIFFKGPDQIDELLKFYSENNDYIIVTDNHLSSQIPEDIPLLVVHHGVARVHLEREPGWNNNWKNLCVYGQDLMFHLRKPNNTIFISPTKFCKNEFYRIYGKQYKLYKNVYIPHVSELDILKFKKKFNFRPVIIGNWSQKSKGSELIEDLKKELPQFKFKPLELDFKDKTIEEYNSIKQEMYISSDIYLCLSVVEGSSYSVLDAMLNNLLIVSTDVGIMENEVSKDSFVGLSWKDLDVKTIASKIKFIWLNKEKYFNKSHKEYFKLINWEKWGREWKKLINQTLTDNITRI